MCLFNVTMLPSEFPSGINKVSKSYCPFYSIFFKYFKILWLILKKYKFICIAMVLYYQANANK